MRISFSERPSRMLFDWDLSFPFFRFFRFFRLPEKTENRKNQKPKKPKKNWLETLLTKKRNGLIKLM